MNTDLYGLFKKVEEPTLQLYYSFKSLIICHAVIFYLDFEKHDCVMFVLIVYDFFQSGLIHSKAMPQLVLSRSEHTVTVKYADAPVDGDPVVIAKRYMVVFCCLSCAFKPYCMTKYSNFMGDNVLKIISKLAYG